MKRELRDQSRILSFRFNEMKTIRWFKQETKSEMFDSATFESSAFLMLILLWILASPLSIWAMIFSISCSSLQRSQNTAGGTSTHEFTNQSKRLGLPVRYRIFLKISHYQNIPWLLLEFFPQPLWQCSQYHLFPTSRWLWWTGWSRVCSK